MNTNTIEKRLLDKELKATQAEISRGMKIINTALSLLPRAHDKTINEEEQRWIMEMFKASQTYATGEWLHMIAEPRLEDFPESMRKRILDRAVDKFLEDVEEMQEITSNLD